jgi:hypothetical protein
MSVVNGQIANQTTFNNAFMSRTAPATSTVAKITLANPDTATIVDAQKAINQNFDTLGVTGVDDADRKNYATNYVIANGDNRKVALEKLDAKFAGVGFGHAHTGADGDGDQVSALNLKDFNPYRAAYQEFTKTTVSGLSVDVSSAFSGKTPGGTAIAAGVITTAPFNRVMLVDGSNGTFLEDTEGQTVYGRLTEAAGVWTLSFYTNEAGVETAHNLASTASVMVFYREVFNAATMPTIPSDPNQYGTLDLTGDIVDASATQRGVVSTGTQTFAGNKTFNGKVILGNSLVFQEEVDTATGTNQSIAAPSKVVKLLTGSGLVSINAITGGDPSQVMMLINNSGADVTIVNSDTGSTSILTGLGIDITLKNKALLWIYKDASTSRWKVIGGSGSSAPLSIAGFGSTPNATGLSYNSGTGALNLEPANATNPGAVSITAQTFAGDKTFKDALSVIEVVDNTTTGAGADLTWTAPYTKLTNASLTSLGNMAFSAVRSNIVYLTNATGTDISILHDTGGTAAKRFLLPDNTDFNFKNGYTGCFIYDYDASRWRLVSVSTGTGTDGGGVVSWITNGNATTNTNGWVTYADSGSRPVDGTGGSPNITWTRSTTLPLEGVASFLFTKDAANRQGQGVGYNFTIDRADVITPKVQTITMDTELVSGTYTGGNDTTDSDLIAYIIDTTSGQVIEPSGFKINAGNQVKATFQPNYNSANYKLVIHVATTSTSAFVMKFDNIKVFTNSVAYGSIITEWQDYTPVYTNLGSVTNRLAKWRRNGSNLEIKLFFTTGTVPAAAPSVSLPNNLVGVVNGLAGGNICAGFWVRGSTSTAHGGAMLANDNATVLTFGPQQTFGSGSTNALNSITTSNTEFNSGENISCFASVQIAAWGVQQLLSQEAETRVVSFAAYSSTGYTQTTQAVNTTVPFTSGEVVEDTHGGWDPVNNEYTIKVPGTYTLYQQGTVFSGTGTNRPYILRPLIKGVNANLNLSLIPTGTSNSASGSMEIPNLKVGDKIKFQALYDAAGTFNIGEIRASIKLKQGPAQITATEAINACYIRNANQSLTSNVTNVLWDTKKFDSHGGMNLATGEYEIKAPGRYEVHASLLGSTSTRTDVYLNGVGQFYGTPGSGNNPSWVYGSFDCVVGDKISIRDNASETVVASSGLLSFHIKRM